ncbi:CU044_5270 family protein [Amycolatopsis taiwanensis]|uniref:CU044_5270 family protein n=1 Tax=Amycolatopsis taiwanensis TaxID=342230 RepID=A0A9W6VLC2_9PSEU|nr:CU044_5270 family protein [Amycolatopsis taiwanensis]GLY71484.1 hypothetical protein Atai01_81030 [Amycolatopsis taiwanensis]
MDEMDLLSRLRPEVDDPDPTTLARHRIALQKHADNPNPARAPRRWHLPRLTITAPILAGVIAVALVAWLTGTPASSGPNQAAPAPAAPLTSVAGVLNLAAEKAENAPSGHGDYTYTSTKTVYNDAGIRVVLTQTWIKVDGTDGLEREDRDGRIEEFRMGSNDSRPGGPPSLYNPTYDYLTTLPTDPEKLRAEVYAQVQRDYDKMGPGAARLYTLDQWVFQRITALLKNAVPPALKAALYRVAATIPGDEYVPDVTDSAGRHGIGVSHLLNNGGDKGVLIFDPNTFQLLGAGGYVSDGRTQADALLASGLVDRIGQTP